MVEFVIRLSATIGPITLMLLAANKFAPDIFATGLVVGIAAHAWSCFVWGKYL